MTWQFCDNERCPDSWHWTDLAGNPEACREARQADAVRLLSYAVRKSS